MISTKQLKFYTVSIILYMNIKGLDGGMMDSVDAWRWLVEAETLRLGRVQRCNRDLYSVEISGRYWHVRNHQKSTIVYLLIYLISLFGICMGTIQSIYTIVRDVMGE